MSEPALYPSPDPVTSVVLIRWPAEDDMRRALASSRTPRLLIVPSGAPPPQVLDDLEDWVLDPAPPGEVAARAATLQHRAAIRGLSPELDEQGLLRRGSRWIDIPAQMVPVVRMLLAAPNELLSDASVSAAYEAGGGTTTQGAIKSMLSRLDERVRKVGLRLRRVQNRGVVLVVP
jgi:hypothetical protein